MKLTVGEQLRSARESRGLTLEDAVKATNIRRAYLQELENDHPETLHSEAQARGFLRLYASYLGIPAAPLITAWDQPERQKEESTHPDTAPSSESISENEVKENHLPQENIPDSPESGEAAETQPTVQEIVFEEQLADTETSSQDELETQPQLLSPFRKVLKRLHSISQFLLKKEKEEKPESENGQPVEQQDHLEDETRSEAVPIRPSNEIMADIGSALRERREALELTLSDAETFTSVKRMYLEAMESGALDQLPSTVQGRGMLSNYAKFLALDESWIIDAYAGALQAVRAEKETSKPRKAQPPLTVRLHIPEKWRRILNPDLILGGAFIVALFAFIIWGGAQVFSVAEPTATEAPSISEMLAQTPSLSPTVVEGTPENGEAVPESTAIPGVTVAEATPTVLATIDTAPLQLYIIVSDRAFLQVGVDGEAAFDGRVEPEDVFTFSGQEEITLLTGNGAALEVYFNQEYLGGLGRVGEVVNIRFSLDGLSTPTPQPTGTPQGELAPVPEDAMEAMEEG